MDTAKRVAPPYNVCLLFWVAKLESSHLLQSIKNSVPKIKILKAIWIKYSIQFMFFKFFLFTSNTLIVFFNWVYFSQLKIVIDIHRIWSPRRLVKIWSFKNLTEIVFRVIATSHDILSPKSIKAFEDDDDAINQDRKRLFRNL